MPLPLRFALADKRRIASKGPQSEAAGPHSRGNALQKAKAAIRNKKPPTGGIGSISRADAARNPFEIHQSDAKYNAPNKTPLD